MPVATNQRRIRNYSATWISCVSSFNTRDNKMSAAALLNNSTCTKRPSRFHLGRYGLTDSEACILGWSVRFLWNPKFVSFSIFFFIYPGTIKSSLKFHIQETYYYWDRLWISMSTECQKPLVCVEMKLPRWVIDTKKFLKITNTAVSRLMAALKTASWAAGVRKVLDGQLPRSLI